ncbi:MAG: hypothetical protein IKZ87_07940 [Actinomycetaceae bacterium]|nr:hypothetical protein [Actinomycetaceae bacterium]
MPDQETLSPSPTQEVHEQPSVIPDALNKKDAPTPKAPAKVCCCNMENFQKLTKVSAIVVFKSSAALLCTASVLLAIAAAFMCIPAIGWMMKVAVFGGSALSALYAFDDLLLPPFALLMLYISIKLMHKTIAFVNSNPEVKKAEDEFRLSGCRCPRRSELLETTLKN